MRTNDVRQILVASGNAAVLAAGGTIDDLGVGQVGVFDANTQLSLDATSDSVREFFLAVGLDRDGDATQDDIKCSAGQYIQRNGVVTYNFREHTAGQPMILKIADYIAKCDQTYALKLEFRNQEIYRTQGFVQFTKTYTIKTSDCDQCEDCPKGDTNEITKEMVNEINLDSLNLVTAKAVTRQAVTIATHGTSADIAEGGDISNADVEALITFNETAADADKVYTNIVLTGNNNAIQSYCTVNLKYFYPRGNVLIASLVDGFTTRANVTIEQEIVFEEGNGYDIAQKEYHASGQQSTDPYILNSTGVPTTYDQFAVRTEKYDQVTLEYNFKSYMGEPFENELATIIAIPNQDTVTRDSIVSTLDAQLANQIVGFDALGDDAADSDVDDDVISQTEDDSVDLDGQG